MASTGRSEEPLIHLEDLLLLARLGHSDPEPPENMMADAVGPERRLRLPTV